MRKSSWRFPPSLFGNTSFRVNRPVIFVVFSILFFSSCYTFKQPVSPGKAAEKSTHKKAEPIGSLQDNPPAVDVKYFYKFPPRVIRVLKESVVAIQVSYPTIVDRILVRQVLKSSGLVVSNQMVVCASHAFGAEKAIWSSNETMCRIYDGENFFSCDLVSVDTSTDLAALKINTTGTGSIKFLKKPARFASAQDKRVMPDRFYALRLQPFGRNFYIPVLLGPYLEETNWVNEILRQTTFGMVSGSTLEGFSGGPLIGPDGKIYGILTEANSAHTYVSTTESVTEFIAETEQILRNQENKPAK